MEQLHVEVRISGKVQGVFFRKNTREEGLGLGLAGFVQNMPDGSVLAHAQGDPESVQKLVEWCSTGPPKAVVETVEVKTLPLSTYKGFTVIR